MSDLTPNCKTYKTIDEQIEYLKNNKNIIIPASKKYILENRNYISIINPYKEFFATGHITVNDENGNKTKMHQYKNSTSIDDYEKMAKLDDIVSSIFYNDIGVFERKLKNLLISRICSLYNENCLYSLQKDVYCITYANEIEAFLDNPKSENLPRFCINFFNIIRKDRYEYSAFLFESRLNFLKLIRNIGIGEESGINNSLIVHYIKSQNIAPFWIIPNALTLGEIHMLYTMLDSNSQKWILSKIKSIKLEDIRIKDIFDFSGQIELIRRIWNTTNHYEPIVAFFINNIKEKRLENSKTLETIKMLNSVIDKDSNNYVFELPEFIETDYNKRKIRILNEILQIIK